MDLTGFWLVLGAVVVLIALAGLYILMLRRRRDHESVQAAQQAAKLAKSQAGSTINATQDNREITAALVASLVGSGTSPEAAALKSDWESAVSAADQAAESYAGLNRSVNDPDQEGLGSATYAQIEISYQRVLVDARGTQQLIKAVEKQIAQLRDRFQGLASTRDDLTRSLGSATVKVTEIKSQGYKTDAAERTIASAQLAIDGLGATIASGHQSMDTLGLADSATELVNLAVKASDEPIRRHESLAVALEELNARISKTKADTAAVAQVYQTLERDYLASSYESVHGNGTEAGKRIALAEKASGAVATAISMDNQSWDEADQQLDRAIAALDEADTLLEAIANLASKLADTKAHAGSAIQRAVHDIANAHDFIANNPGDVNQAHHDELNAATTLLSSAQEALTAAQPDYLQVLALVDQACKSAGSVLAVAQTEHEAAIRLREQAAATMRAADHAITVAQNYIASHRGDIGRSATNYLSRRAP